MKSTLIYSRPCKMKELNLYPAMVVNYYIDTLEKCLEEKLKKESEYFKTIII